MLKRKFAGRGKWYIIFVLTGILALGWSGSVRLVLAAENETESVTLSYDSESAVTDGAITENTVIMNDSDDAGEEIKTEEEIVISGKIEPSVIETEQDISGIEMNKIVFSGNEQATGADSDGDSFAAVMERVYTLNVKGKGGLYLALAQVDTTSFQSLKVQVYSDILLTKKIGKDYTVKPDTKVIDTRDYYLKAAGTYYLKFTYQRNTEDENVTGKAFAMTAAFMYSTDRTLQEGKKLVTYADSKQRTVYYKINANKRGLLSFTAIPENGKDLLTGRITLCDKNKQPVSVAEYVSGSDDGNQAVHAYYAVRKGTYYIKAKLNASYISSFVLETVKDQAGAGMGAARKLVLDGKDKKSVLYLSDSTETEKWYCFRLKKNQNFSIIVNSCVNGYLNIEVCNSAGVTVKSGETKFYTGTKILKTSSKWQRGTYYVRITKGKKSAKSSGYFSVSVK